MPEAEPPVGERQLLRPRPEQEREQPLPARDVERHQPPEQPLLRRRRSPDSRSLTRIRPFLRRRDERDPFDRLCMLHLACDLVGDVEHDEGGQGTGNGVRDFDARHRSGDRSVWLPTPQDRRSARYRVQHQRGRGVSGRDRGHARVACGPGLRSATARSWSASRASSTCTTRTSCARSCSELLSAARSASIVELSGCDLHRLDGPGRPDRGARSPREPPRVLRVWTRARDAPRAGDLRPRPPFRGARLAGRGALSRGRSLRAAQILAVGSTPGLAERARAGRRSTGEIVEVLVVALNPLDLAVAAGRFYGGHPPLPYVPGCEAPRADGRRQPRLRLRRTA